MKVLTWNLNHRTRQKKIPPGVLDVILKINPDIFAFTEFVDGETRRNFKTGLANLGYQFLISETQGRHNQVLVAAKGRVSPGPISPPDNIALSLPSNALHVLVGNHEIDVFGIRIPDFSKTPSKKVLTWEWILETGASLVKRPSIILGDFNTDPRYSEAKCGHYIEKLKQIGFTHALPNGKGSSFVSLRGSDCIIDHTFLSPHFNVSSADFVSSIDMIVLAGRTEKNALSDHLALLVNARLK